MRLTKEQFFVWFNKLIFSLLYLRHQGKSTAVVSVAEGARFKVRVNTSDRLILWEIWSKKVYDDPRLRLGENGVVLDIGAHIGAFAVRAAKLATRGRVYAYEASRNNFDILAENRRLNNLENLHIENSAVAGTRGTLPLYIPADNAILGSLLQSSSNFVELVQATTLADIVKDHDLSWIDYLKMDVEGAEYDILLNCSSETLGKIRHVTMEYHDFEGKSQNHTHIVDLFNSHGFNISVEEGIFPQPRWFGTGIKKIGVIKAWQD